jgi:membrane protease YdiL (CAAX protease family)
LGQRWWDGEEWTSYVFTGGVVAWDPRAEEITAPEPEGVRGVGLAVVGYVVGVALGAAIAIGMRRLDEPGGPSALLATSEGGLWLGFVGTCVLVSRRRGSGSLRSDFGLGIKRIDLAFGLAGSFAARVISSFAIAPFALAFRHATRPEQSVFDTLLHSWVGWLVLSLVICVGAPVVEELFFRGLVQTRLIGRWGAVRGIIVTSVLFGAAHLINWQGPITFAYALGIAAAGLVLGAVRYQTGRIGTSMATHMFFNAQVLIILAIAR